MADGVTHQKYLKLGWYIVLPVGLILTIITALLNSKYYYLYPIFLYLNFHLCNYIDPDADQISITISEGNALRTKNVFFVFGFIGALFVAYSFIYAYLIGLVGGHRSVFSHGVLIGTLGRMLYYNIPLMVFLMNFYSYGLLNWNWTTNIGLYESCKMNIWFIPYIASQFIAWFIGDGIHLILDTEWAKGKLYIPKKIKRG